MEYVSRMAPKEDHQPPYVIKKGASNSEKNPEDRLDVKANFNRDHLIDDDS